MNTIPPLPSSHCFLSTNSNFWPLGDHSDMNAQYYILIYFWEGLDPGGHAVEKWEWKDIRSVCVCVCVMQAKLPGMPSLLNCSDFVSVAAARQRAIMQNQVHSYWSASYVSFLVLELLIGPELITEQNLLRRRQKCDTRSCERAVCHISLTMSGSSVVVDFEVHCWVVSHGDCFTSPLLFPHCVS